MSRRVERGGITLKVKVGKNIDRCLFKCSTAMFVCTDKFVRDCTADFCITLLRILYFVMRKNYERSHFVIFSVSFLVRKKKFRKKKQCSVPRCCLLEARNIFYSKVYGEKCVLREKVNGFGYTRNRLARIKLDTPNFPSFAFYFSFLLWFFYKGNSEVFRVIYVS